MTFFDFCFGLNLYKPTQLENIIIQTKSFEIKVSFARNLNYHFKALESQALSRAYFLWVPIGVPIFGHRVTLYDAPL
mgnify:CR=1 FL=1